MCSKSDGVWYPDSMGASLIWRGISEIPGFNSGFHVTFNPFGGLADRRALVVAYTEQLAYGDSVLQQYMDCDQWHHVSTNRSNLAVAAPDQRPSWLGKPGLLDFASVRSYPLRQLHRLAAMLRQRRVPVCEPAVRVLVRQALFHVGELSDEAAPQRIWREGWEHETLPALLEELSMLADELANTPRSHEEVELLGELAAYLSEHEAAFRAIARQFAAMTAGHADTLQQELDSLSLAPRGGTALAHPGSKTDQDARISEIKAKQLRWRAMALGCHVAGDLNAADASQMVELLVMINHGYTFQDNNNTRNQLRHSLARARAAVAAHAGDLLHLAAVSPDAVLTAALRRVVGRAPQHLAWKQLCSSTCSASLASFDAVARDMDGRETLYSLNVLTGAVLVNGCPPDRLPSDITGHPLFLRTFGDANFEVFPTTGGALQTTHLICGRHYDFLLSPGNRLTVREHDPSDPAASPLELLDAAADHSCAGWGSELPPRLRELHSHWLYRLGSGDVLGGRGGDDFIAGDVILLRPRNFLQRDVHFVVKCTSSDNDSGSTKVEGGKGGSANASAGAEATGPRDVLFDCRRMPQHLRAVPWQQLVVPGSKSAQLRDRLVQTSTSTDEVLRVLSKFEDPRYIHVHEPALRPAPAAGVLPLTTATDASAAAQQQADDWLRYELPRYGIEFELSAADGQLRSVNGYAGAVLKTQQQLVRTSQSGSSTSGGRQDQRPMVHYTLPNFTRYLLLERQGPHGSSGGAGAAEELVLVPRGSVKRAAGGQVEVAVSASSNASLEAHCYHVHGRFRDLRAPTELGRLQLAALYAATSTLLPEPASCMTGAQLAAQLVRQSWGTRPLTAEEQQHLHTAAALGGHLCPALPLVAQELVASAQQLSFLHDAVYGSSNAASPSPTLVDVDAAFSHMQVARAGRFWPGGNHRGLLAAGEEARLLGTRWAANAVAEAGAGWPSAFGKRPIAELRPCPVAAEVVKTMEMRLLGMVGMASSAGVQAPDMARRASSSEGGGMYRGRTRSSKCGSPARGPGGEAAYPMMQGEQGDRQGLGPLECDMHDELRGSWDAHHAMEVAETVVERCQAQIVDMQGEVRGHRASVEAHLIQSLGEVGSELGTHAAAFRVMRLADAAPWASPSDLMRLAVDPPLAQRFNPFFSEQSCRTLAAAANLWLQLCVLEDRLERLVALAEGVDEAALARELLVHRTWDPATHPEWLVFEAEGRLQIRPQQHTVAQHLIDSVEGVAAGSGEPGSICQLNMGEGKTRVILPMLVLHLARPGGARVVRLNFLSRLLGEGYDHLQLNLTASSLGRKIAVVPFNRDVALEERDVHAMGAVARHMRQEGGVLLMAPEWRLSLELKRHELAAKAAEYEEASDAAMALGATVAALDQLQQLPFTDVLDESDEVLRHKMQLIYCVGAHVPLPAREQRAAAIQAALTLASSVLSIGAIVPKGAAEVEPPRLASRGPGKLPGSYSGLRLVPGKELDSAPQGVGEVVAAALLECPPYDLRWIGNLGQEDKSRVLAAVTDGSRPMTKLLGNLKTKLEESEVHQVLALRGLLASGYDLLVHALQKRHLVDYGINRGPSARKRLAVPFRAAQTPSERSEFAQPDVALVLTTLSYYFDGLAREEFVEALRVLVGLGASSRDDIYNEWLELSRPDITPEELQPIDSASKIDTTSATQVDRMYAAFSHNMAVVGFWLRHVVFKGETGQFPLRMTATPWNLATNSTREVVGFSGTKDNHRLLPVSVGQREPEGPNALELRATDGKMLRLLLGMEGGYLELQHEDGRGRPRPMWQAVLDSAIDGGMHALLDAGALLASSGTSNAEAAQYALGRLRERGLLGGGAGGAFQGVTFFDGGEGGWVVADGLGRRAPRQRSAVAERDCFVIYDDARCRGADLKLRPRAVGLLTLGLSITKDKVMQAAGRLRQLMRGGTQAVSFAGPPDVTAKIRGSASLAGNAPIVPLHVMRWVMANTVRATQAGVLHWTAQGAYFAATLGAPERVVRPELLELDDFYGGGRREQPAPGLVERTVSEAERTCRGPAGGGGGGEERETRAAARSEALALLAEVKERGVRMAAGFEVHASTHGGGGSAGAEEECERELEKEEEEEEEVEAERPSMAPEREADWVYETATTALSPKDLLRAGVERLGDAIGRQGSLQLSPGSLGGMAWSQRVWATRNFLRAAELRAGDPANDYMRAPQAVLALPSGDIVLLSEREADAVTAQMRRKASRKTCTTSLLSLPYMHQAFARGDPVPLLTIGKAGRTIGGGGSPTVCAGVGAAEMVSAAVFAGDASYPRSHPGVWHAMCSLVGGHRGDVEELMAARSAGELMTRSDLERACDSGHRTTAR